MLPLIVHTSWDDNLIFVFLLISFLHKSILDEMEALKRQRAEVQMCRLSTHIGEKCGSTLFISGFFFLLFSFHLHCCSSKITALGST